MVLSGLNLEILILFFLNTTPKECITPLKLGKSSQSLSHTHTVVSEQVLKVIAALLYLDSLFVSVHRSDSVSLYHQKSGLCNLTMVLSFIGKSHVKQGQ